MSDTPAVVKKIDPLAERMYGAGNFIGYTKIGEMTDLIPAFKDYYYSEKVKDNKKPAFDIIDEFNQEQCYPVGRRFHPYPNQYRMWRKKWDLDLMNQASEQDIVLYEPKRIKQVLKTRGEDGELVLGSAGYNDIEAGVTTLAGELINDAAQMLRDDQMLEDVYTSDELMKRRAYVVNVFSHTTRLVQGKASLMLKASAEKRESANFLMGLLAKATSGKMTEEEMGMLESTYSEITPHNEPAKV